MTRAETIVAELQAVLDRNAVNVYFTVAEIRERGMNGAAVALIDIGSADAEGRVPLKVIR